MPPSPLEERLAPLQRPKTLALRLDRAFSTERQSSLRLKKVYHSAEDPTHEAAFTQHTNHQLTPTHKSRLYSPLDQKAKENLQSLKQSKLFSSQKVKVSRNYSKENSKPPLLLDSKKAPSTDSSNLSSPEANCCSRTMHPLKCGCRGCWRFARCEEASGTGCLPSRPTLKSLSCFAGAPSLQSLACSGCSPPMKKLGCLPCGAALKSLACLTCNPSVKSVSSSCSFCSSDPIVTYDPKGSSFSCNYDDDYSVRTIWPEELAKKMTKCKVHTQTPMILDCRNLVEYTKSQLQGAMHFSCSDTAGRRRLQQGKLAMLDFITSREGRDSLKRLWPKEPDTSCSTSQPTPAPSSDLLSKPPPTQNMHLVLNSLNKAFPDTSPAPKGSISDAREGQESTQDDGFRPLDNSGGLLTPDIENAELSTILPFLFLGNERDAQDLERILDLNIGHVINVTTHLPLYHLESSGVRYKRLPATDNSKQNLRQYFEEAFEFIEEAQQCGKGVLVHCQAGVSRSATIVIAYLMKHTLMTMGDAYKYVKGRRPAISPNLNFMGQLLEFETDLNSGVTPRILTPKLNGLETEV
ncbi:dual specificity protein phosphatase 10-like [Ambystoma mexicanum]|uniref:dual specificity protein phosphatase 10-like n=1 Tax=Ambystoma mexicanum TaxID=8296 RepID=UPI0037E944DE